MADVSSYLRTDYKAVDKHDPLNAVLGWLTGDAKNVPIIMDDGKPFGIVNERALMGRSLDGHARVHQFTLATRAIPQTADASAARERMAEHRAAYLPVADEHGKCAGYVRAVDVARDEEDARRAMDVAVPVTTLREDSTIGEALNAFGKEYVEYLPVNGTNGRLAGVLSRSAVVRITLHSGNKGRLDAGGEKISMLNMPVSGFMDSAPTLVRGDAGVPSLLTRIEGAGYALVGDTERLLGLATAETLFRPRG